MNTRSGPGPGASEAGTTLPGWIEATDLTETPAWRALWRRRTGPTPAFERPGSASPMGYWLTELNEPIAPATDSPPLRIELVASGDGSGSDPDGADVPIRAQRPTRVTRVKGANATDGDLLLTIGPERARIVTSAATWKQFAEPVLLAVCQYWRFLHIDVQLDRLTAQAEQDLGHAAMSVPSTLWNRSRLLGTARAVRALLLDLPHFMEPLTDPFPFCTSERSVQTYRALAEKLNLPEWCEAIDDRAEMVEDTYASVTEKLFEYRNFAWGSFLEVTIIVILLAELVLQIWEHFASR